MNKYISKDIFIQKPTWMEYWHKATFKVVVPHVPGMRDQKIVYSSWHFLFWGSLKCQVMTVHLSWWKSIAWRDEISGLNLNSSFCASGPKDKSTLFHFNYLTKLLNLSLKRLKPVIFHVSLWTSMLFYVHISQKFVFRGS